MAAVVAGVHRGKCVFTTSIAEYSGIYIAATKEGEAQSTSRKALPVEYDELGEQPTSR